MNPDRAATPGDQHKFYRAKLPDDFDQWWQSDDEKKGKTEYDGIASSDDELDEDGIKKSPLSKRRKTKEVNYKNPGVAGNIRGRVPYRKNKYGQDKPFY